MGLVYLEELGNVSSREKNTARFATVVLTKPKIFVGYINNLRDTRPGGTYH